MSDRTSELKQTKVSVVTSCRFDMLQMLARTSYWGIDYLGVFVPAMFPFPGMVFPGVFVTATVFFVPGNSVKVFCVPSSSVKVFLAPVILCAGWLLAVR